MKFEKLILPFRVKRPLLALGADLKNRICFAYGREAFISKPLGDLGQIENYRIFVKTIKKISLKYRKKFKIIAYDAHPGYHCSNYVSELSYPGCILVAVQHHHAHICSAMAENHLTNSKVIGIAFDGTGFGPDSTLWGAEILVCDYLDFSRVGHLKYIRLAGAEKAIKEIWRLGAAWLFLIYKDSFLKLNIDFVKTMDKYRWSLIKKILLHEFNSPLSSSSGRLFDAVSAIVLGISRVDYEGQAAIELEKKAERFISRRGLRDDLRPYRYRIIKKNARYVIDPCLMFKDIVKSLIQGENRGAISFRFHLTLAQMVSDLCLKIRKDTAIETIVFSGGVFQNKILLNLVLDLLYRHKFKVFYHQGLSPSDLSISLGQVAVANFKSCA